MSTHVSTLAPSYAAAWAWVQVLPGLLGFKQDLYAVAVMHSYNIERLA